MKRKKIIRRLCCLSIFGCVLVGFNLTAVAEMTTIDVGFKNTRDLFKATPGDSIQLVKNSMRWQLKYRGKGYRWCIKEFPAGTAKGMDGMTLRMKSDSEFPLWLQVDEEGGEGFYKWVTPTKEWKTIQIKLSELEVNTDKVLNGKLDVEKIMKIMLLDTAALNGTKGQRTIWFSDWKWTSTAKSKPGSRSVSPEQVVSTVKRKRQLSTGKVGLSGVPQNYSDSKADYLKVFQKANEAGVQVLSAGNAQWTNEIEPRPGVFDWGAFEKFFAVMDSSGFTFEISFDFCGLFFHGDVQKPDHFKVRSITDPRYMKRYKNMATSFLRKFANRTNYFVIHAEGAYNYFERNPKHLTSFCRMLAEIRQLAKLHNPNILVGVNTDPFNKEGVLIEINNAVDFMAYDIMKSKELTTPKELEKLIQKLIHISGGKKIAVQNGGWSTAASEQSSEQQQVDFVREFYRVLLMHHESIEYASFFVLYDEDIEFMTPIYRQQVAGAPESFVKKMAESNGRFGLFRSNGSAKPAWHELKRQVEQYYKKIP